MKSVCWNEGWLFSSDIDSEKKAVRLPHDAMQTEKRVEGLKDGAASGFYPGGTYTYEKNLHINEDEVDDTILLEFEGIYMKSSVYLNGELVGGRIYGYSDFYVDLTGKVRAGDNEIRVIADNSQCSNSRWYSGSGIYRDVWLHTAEQEYIRNDGIKVETVSVDPAKVHISVTAEKKPDTRVKISILDGGSEIASAYGQDVCLDMKGAKLWSADEPYLYEVKARLLDAAGAVIDEVTDSFGVRQLTWNVEKGLMINGRTVKLRGGCMHHDHAFIGTAEYDDASMRKVSRMKEAGFNAIRVSHNPASKALLRACDRVGMYVMNETFDTWFGLKSPYDYAMYFEEEWQKDVSDMIRISYNHPSVVMYSIGNEVYLKDYKRAARQAKAMADFCRSLDATRPVTNCMNPGCVLMGDSKSPEAKRGDIVDPREAGKGSALTGSRLVNTLISYLSVIMATVGNEKKMKKINEVFEPLDIAGLNYGTHLYDAQHKDFPDRILVGSETFPKTICKSWKLVEEMPWVVGDFLWTAWDYLGEAGVGTVGYGDRPMFTQPFPTIAAGCCNIDLTGEITPQGYYTSIVYGQYKKPYIAVHPVNHSGEKCYTGSWRFTDAIHSWTWPGCENRKAAVDVYSDADQVELFINGRSLGKMKPAEYVASFELPYETGEIMAVAYSKSGEMTGTDALNSAGSATVISLKPEKDRYAVDDQLIYLPIELTDEAGIRKMLSDRTITVHVSGQAKLAGLGNASLKQESLMPYAGDSIMTCEGRALAILRTSGKPGTVDIEVSAEGAGKANLTTELQ